MYRQNFAGHFQRIKFPKEGRGRKYKEGDGIESQMRNLAAGEERESNSLPKGQQSG